MGDNCHAMNNSVDVLAFGEVLWDVIDGVPHIGGAPFNFAAHAARLGLSCTVISAVGNDDLGRRARSEVVRRGVSDAYLFENALPTGTVDVTVKDGMPSYSINYPVAWDEIEIPAGCTLPSAPRLVYFGTLASRGEVSAATLSKLLAAYPDSAVFFDVNLRQSYWSREQVLDGIANATVLKLNDEEVEMLKLRPSELFVDNLRLDIIVVTRGSEGCEVFTRGGERFASPAIGDGPVVDTVGAGDSFSAAFVAALLAGKNVHAAAEEGNRLGGRVAARAGAIPDDL